VTNHEDRTRPLPGLAEWERELAAIVAYRFERIEPEELKAELYKAIIELKAGSLSHVRHWGKYLTQALRRRAINWRRHRRTVAKRESILSEPDTETRLFFSPKEDNLDDQLAMAQFRKALGHELEELLEVLEKHNFNQVKAAQELGIHRNTLRARIRKIKQIAHEFSLGARSEERIVRKARKPNEIVILSSRFLRTVARIRLSGSAWRILLWIIGQLSRRKQATIPLSWYRIAKVLKLDHANAIRAGQSLVRSGLVFIQDDRIGLRRKIGRSQLKRNSRASRRFSTRTDVKKQRF
jgi:DNA-directed RNA polymerase specialized sigma24 family protein